MAHSLLIRLTEYFDKNEIKVARLFPKLGTLT